jgi:hypothetical protein
VELGDIGGQRGKPAGADFSGCGSISSDDPTLTTMRRKFLSVGSTLYQREVVLMKSG